jgi:adenosylmethionine-8-amino-7-oxononanoate aminotransferase
MPLGAVLASGEIIKAIESGSGVFEHGFTYSGHPVACAAGLAVNEYLRKHDLISSVEKRQPDFFNRLEKLKEKHRIIGDVRGLGFMAGIELVPNQEAKEPFPASDKIAQKVGEQAAKAGLLVYPGSGFVDGLRGDHVMITPPFNISEQEMDTLFVRLDAALAAVGKEAAVAAR